MLEAAESISLPVTISSAFSDQGQYFSRKITETFSQYEGNQFVPNRVIQELAVIYKSMDGNFSYANIDDTNRGFCTFCEYLIANDGGLKSIYDLTTSELGRFFEFCQVAYPIGWKNRLKTFSARLRYELDVIWPLLVIEIIPTEGYSASASAMMREKLKSEIDRIRSKIGRLNNDLDIGKVFEIDMSAKNVRAKDIPGFLTAGKADIIKTIRHLLPHFPLDKFNSADRSNASLNPGQWILRSLSIATRAQCLISDILRGNFSGLEDVYDYYFPTTYDATCIVMYAALLTGWNRQVVESVGSDELNLRFRRNHLMNAWSGDHVIIRGKKTRGQPKGRPKIYTHISDKNDPYGLYNVLKDFYELTKTIRFGINPIEDRCIFMAISTKSQTVSCFGPGAKIPKFATLCTEGVQGSNTAKFLLKHEIYDDTESDEPQVRINTLSWRLLRTSYETVLEDMGLPLYVRQMLLGHSSIDTTMFPYGSDKHATKIQMDQLRKAINSVHDDYGSAKYFHGAFLKPDNDPRRWGHLNYKVVSLARTDWNDNIIMVCKSSRKPTWPGHEHYVKTGAECSHLANCLFCNQCLIGKETLPYLAQWDLDIQDYFEEEADWDLDLKLLECQSALKIDPPSASKIDPPQVVVFS